MLSGEQNQSNAGARKPAITALGGRVSTQIAYKTAMAAAPQQVSLKQSARSFGPEGLLAWMTGVLAAAACVAPWLTHGWLLFGLVVAIFSFIACYDALALWLSREDGAAILLLPERGLRGRAGQTIPIPLAITASSGGRPLGELRVALMATTPESETAFQVEKSTQLLKLESSMPGENSTATANHPHVMLWPWTPDVALLRRGVWPAPRVGTERRSQLKLWRLRRWFDSAVSLRIEADIRSGRKEILRSPVYRSLVASRQSMWVGHGRDFERLREYQPGDNYSEIAWKSTARRSAPVTRLFQWEQKQEVYFVVDQSRASAMALDAVVQSDGQAAAAGPARRLLDLSVETALVCATVALELGDEFGLVTYADEPKSWLRTGSGQAHFNRFRDILLDVEPLATTADYESLFSEIRMRLRRRAYLVLLADLTERSISDSLRRGLGLVRSSHAVLVTSILPAHAEPAFSSEEELRSDDDVYAALAGEKENQRLRALARQMQHLNVQLQFVPSNVFLRAAAEGYMKSKREQRL
jgi:uncharacterized protein (DUF58 family)